MESREWGLTYDQSKGKWKFRLTLDRGRKKVGKRITVALSPCVTLEDAIFARDVVARGLEMVGLKLVRRTQKRRGANSPSSQPEPAA